MYTIQYYSVIKNNQILPLLMKWMQLETTMFSEKNLSHLLFPPQLTSLPAAFPYVPFPSSPLSISLSSPALPIGLKDTFFQGNSIQNQSIPRKQQQGIPRKQNPRFNSFSSCDFTKGASVKYSLWLNGSYEEWLPCVMKLWRFLERALQWQWEGVKSETLHQLALVFMSSWSTSPNVCVCVCVSHLCLCHDELIISSNLPWLLGYMV